MAIPIQCLIGTFAFVVIFLYGDRLEKLGKYVMTIVTVDGKDYDLDILSAEAKAQLEMVLACDRKLSELKADVAIIQTARNAYVAALKEMLPKGAAN